MDVRTKGNHGALLFTWDAKTQTLELVRKKMLYRVKFLGDSFQVMEAESKYDCRPVKP